MARAQFGSLELDSRVVPWADLTRLALEGGVFLPGYRPVTESELSAILTAVTDRAEAGDAPGLAVAAESRRLAWLRARYRDGNVGYALHGCSCKQHPAHLRLSGRVVGGFSGLGNPVVAEGGLGFVAGHNLFLEPSLEFAVGRFWLAGQWRVGGRVAAGGYDFLDRGESAASLTWPAWPLPTGRADVRDWRLRGGAGHGQCTPFL